MKPYYRQGGITLYHADCRALLPRLGGTWACITDPPWPGGRAAIAGHEDPFLLLRTVAQLLAPRVSRLVIQLGCDTDPRLLAAVPPELPYIRTCWLEYAVPCYKGRILYSGDVGYVFGQPPPPAPGRTLLPGRLVAGSLDRLPARKPARPRPQRSFTKRRDRASILAHPCPRRLELVRWLVHWYSTPADVVLDPFAGSGTTLLAARALGRPAVGIEIEEKFCRAAARRLEGEEGLNDEETEMRRSPY